MLFPSFLFAEIFPDQIGRGAAPCMAVTLEKFLAAINDIFKYERLQLSLAHGSHSVYSNIMMLGQKVPIQKVVLFVSELCIEYIHLSLFHVKA